MYLEEVINFRTNNLNLIRLFAAFQVLIGHLHNYFEVSPSDY